jgi:hypothetical protein
MNIFIIRTYIYMKFIPFVNVPVGTKFIWIHSNDNIISRGIIKLLYEMWVFHGSEHLESVFCCTMLFSLVSGYLEHGYDSFLWMLVTTSRLHCIITQKITIPTSKSLKFITTFTKNLQQTLPSVSKCSLSFYIQLLSKLSSHLSFCLPSGLFNFYIKVSRLMFYIQFSFSNVCHVSCPLDIP